MSAFIYGVLIYLLVVSFKDLCFSLWERKTFESWFCGVSFWLFLFGFMVLIYAQV